MFSSSLPTKGTITRVLLALVVIGFAPVPDASAQLFGRHRPLSLNLLNADRTAGQAQYMVGLRQLIESNWIPKPLTPPMRARVRFEISPDGTLQNIEMISSSGNQSFDKRAIGAISESRAYYPAPTNLMLEATFDSHDLDIAELQQRARSILARRSSQMQYQNPPPLSSQQGYVEQSFTRPTDDDWHDSQQKTPLEDAPNSTPAWSEPLISAAFTQLTFEEKQEYKDWLTQWFQIPFEDRFSFLTSAIESASPPNIVKPASKRKR